MKTKALIEKIKSGSYYIHRFPDFEEDNRPLLDTPEGFNVIDVTYSLVTPDGVNVVKGGDIGAFIEALPYGSTLRVPTYLNRQPYATDIYTRVSRSEEEGTWNAYREFSSVKAENDAI